MTRGLRGIRPADHPCLWSSADPWEWEQTSFLTGLSGATRQQKGGRNLRRWQTRGGHSWRSPEQSKMRGSRHPSTQGAAVSIVIRSASSGDLVD